MEYIGKEHYCPLSLLRVFGLTEVEEYEYNEANEASTDEEQQNTENKQEDDGGKQNGIFESAKNVVVGLVNNVAKTFGSQSEINRTGLSPPDIVTLVKSDNLVEYFEDANFISTCIQRTLYSKYNSSLNPICKFGMTFVLVKRMCPSLRLYRSVKRDIAIKQQTVIEGNTERLLPPIPPPPLEKVSKVIITENEAKAQPKDAPSTNSQEIAADESDEKEIVVTTMNEVEENTHSSQVKNIIATARDSPSNVVATTPKSVHTVVSDNTCSTRAKPSIHITDLLPQPSFKDTPATTTNQIVTQALMEVVSQETITTSPPTETIESTVSDTKSGQATTTTVAPTKEESVDVLEFKVNENNTEGSSSMVAEKIETKPNAGSNTTVALPSLTEPQNMTEASEKKPINSLPSVSEGGNTKGDNVKSGGETNLVTDTVDVIEAEEASKLMKDLPDEAVSASTVVESESKVEITPPITASSSTIQESTITTEKTQASKSKSTPQSIVAAGGGSGIPGSKESIVVKLSAKIKALQENLTMSMMYLEEMSEKYVMFFLLFSVEKYPKFRLDSTPSFQFQKWNSGH